MGRRIDRLIGFVLLIAAAYLLFLRATDSVGLACGFTLLCAALARPTRPRAARMSALAAGEILNRWALGPDDEARAQLVSLTGDEALSYLPRHPGALIGYSDVFSAWKSRRGEAEITVCVPCRADARARAYARTLTAPRVRLLDAPRLIALIRASDLTPPEGARLKALRERLRSALWNLPARGSAGKRLLWGLALMLIYLATGRASCLILALAALFLAGISFRYAKGTEG